MREPYYYCFALTAPIVPSEKKPDGVAECEKDAEERAARPARRKRVEMSVKTNRDSMYERVYAPQVTPEFN